MSEGQKILLIIGGIIITIFILLFFNSYLVRQPLQNVEIQKETIQYTPVKICSTDLVSACGTLKNNTSKMLNLKVYINAYDDQGNQIKNDTIYIYKLEPYHTYKYNDGYFPKETKSLKIIDIQSNES